MAEPDGKGVMKIEVLADADAVARVGAAFIAAEARASVAARGRFIMAISGGRTPWKMLRALADEPMPSDVYVVQVDERVAPTGDPKRNLTHLHESLLTHCPLDAGQVHAMPVESPDLVAASERYARRLREIAGSPAVLDVAHLGLGPDGHTASVRARRSRPRHDHRGRRRDGIYQGRRRMTLTYPVLNRSRRILWLITGQDKADMLPRLSQGDSSIPAGRISRDQSVVLVDEVRLTKGAGGCAVSGP
jgi:6-phosphogluconolactonase